MKHLLCALIAAGWALQVTAQTLPSQTVAALQAQSERTRLGAGHPDVLIVEYLDYDCPFCKKSAPALARLLKADPGVSVVIKEWPIFGGASVYAARCALAASWQGKFGPTHDALIGASRDLDGNSDVDAVLRGVPGLDLARLATDRARHAGEIDAMLARSARETHDLGLQGTPVFIVGRQLLTSALNFTQLQQLVAAARAAH